MLPITECSMLPRLCVILFLLVLPTCRASLPDEFQCADPQCSEIISTGETLRNAPAGNPGFLNIKTKKPISILSQSMDKKTYGVSYQNQRGFVSANHVILSSIRVKADSLILVPTASIPWNPVKLPPVLKPEAVDSVDTDTSASPEPVSDNADPIVPPNSDVPVDEPLAIKKIAYTTTNPESEKTEAVITSNDSSTPIEALPSNTQLPSVDPSPPVIENAAPVNPNESNEKPLFPEVAFKDPIQTENITNDAINSEQSFEQNSTESISEVPILELVPFLDNATLHVPNVSPDTAPVINEDHFNSESVNQQHLQNSTTAPIDDLPEISTQNEEIVNKAKPESNGGLVVEVNRTTQNVFDNSNPAENNTLPDNPQEPAETELNNINNITTTSSDPLTVTNTISEAETILIEENPTEVHQTGTTSDEETILLTEPKYDNDASEEIENDDEDEEEDEEDEEVYEEDEENEDIVRSEYSTQHVPEVTVVEPTEPTVAAPSEPSITAPTEPSVAAPTEPSVAAPTEPTFTPTQTPNYEPLPTTQQETVESAQYDNSLLDAIPPEQNYPNVYNQPPIYHQDPNSFPSENIQVQETTQPFDYSPNNAPNTYTSEPLPPSYIQAPSVDEFSVQSPDSPVVQSPGRAFESGVGVGSVEELVAKTQPDAEPTQRDTPENNPIVDVWGTISNWFGSVEDSNNNAPNRVKAAEKVVESHSDGHVVPIEIGENDYCDSLSSNACPPAKFMDNEPRVNIHMDPGYPLAADIGIDGFAQLFVDEVSALSVIFVYSSITGLIVVLFLLGNRFVNNRRREQSLLSKLNIIERKLMTSGKECDLLKGTLVDTKHKLTSIEDNSFGSNEMVISLRHEVNTKSMECATLRAQVQSLETELETATEAGLELNKMVSDLLNQTGSDSIISSVEEMQRQLNEQEETTAAINTLLGEKSRENSELQVRLADVSNKYDSELAEVVTQNETLVADYNHIQAELDELRKQYAQEIEQLAATSDAKLKATTQELAELKITYEKIRVANVSNEARIQVLDQLIKELRSGKPFDTSALMDSAKHKTELVALTKEKERLSDKLDGEQDARKLLEDHVKVISEEMNSLRQGFSLAEKEKLEAQTRLEVLSAYFKEKETQLQKELSLKEALAMKQQGDTTSTVERIRGLQADIQDLRSQNDSLKAEIEAQQAAHKAQMAAAENRAHESWISARQTQRRFEEALSEAGALRRKLTSLGDASGTADSSLPNLHNSMEGGLAGDAPSPIHMDVSGANSAANAALLMGVLPPPPFLPPPFMAPPPMLPPLNFMPPPQAPMLPFLPGQPLPPPPGEMRPPPLGRLMSPPPHLGGQTSNRYSPDDRDRRYQRGDRYSPDEYDYDSEDDHRDHRQRDYRRHHNNRSPYETETDFSPPPSPGYGRGGGGRGGAGGHPAQSNHQSAGPYSPPRSNQSSRNTLNNSKGGLSSGSVDSLGSRKSHHGPKV